MEWYPHLTVATIVEKEGKFLMVEEAQNGVQVLNQPAGHMEQHESLAEAAIRETLEETGWQIKLEALLGFSQYTSPDNGVTYTRSTFIALPVQQMTTALDPDITAAHWMSYEDVLENSSRLRSPMVLSDLQRYRSGENYQLSIIKHFDDLTR